MKAIWESKAVNGRRQIANYILNKFGEKAKKDFMLEIQDTNTVAQKQSVYVAY